MPREFYGFVHKGGKGQFAHLLHQHIPCGKRFVDLFCGGCSMTDAVIDSNKFDAYLINDLNPMMPEAYLMALDGELVDPIKRWVSKDEFHKFKATDPYVALCYSFSANRMSYMYGPDNEQAMHAAHNVICYGDYWLLGHLLGEEAVRRIHGAVEAETETQQRRHAFCHAIKALIADGVDVGRAYSTASDGHYITRHLTLMQRVESLARPTHRPITATSLDYREYEHKDGDVVYCDPPYAGTENYGVAFDTDKFWDWARTREYPVYVSESKAPDGFACLYERLAATGYGATMSDKRKRRMERLFVREDFVHHLL